jgi:OmpA family
MRREKNRMQAGRCVVALVLLASLAGCAAQPSTPTAASPTPPPVPVPFDQAVLNAGNAVFAATVAAGGHTVVIDPLVNGVTGEQSASTKTLGTRLTDLAREHYPQLDVRPFDATTVEAAPIVLVGTFTPVNASNQPSGPREAYRFCLVAADLKSGKTVAKSVARALPAGVDATPTRMFADSPSWTEDPSVKAYISTCQATKVGDPIPPTYVNGIITAAIINQAMTAYEAGNYRGALDLFENARTTPAGSQLRVYNGLYLTRTRLGQPERVAAFGDLVAYGLKNNRLAVKLLFRPASTAFVADPRVSGDYDMWLRQIADHSATSGACLQVTGHTSASGSAALNEQLSVLRAEYVEQRLQSDNPALAHHLIAAGEGSKQNLVGTGTDDAGDALDRRVEFKVIPSC